jgi:hypothetical protein
VSDATATRYLEELELWGHIRQVGRTGKHVTYKKAYQLNGVELVVNYPLDSLDAINRIVKIILLFIISLARSSK